MSNAKRRGDTASTQHQDDIARALGLTKGSRYSASLFNAINKYIQIGTTDAGVIAAVSKLPDYKRWKQSQRNNAPSANRISNNLDINTAQKETQVIAGSESEQHAKKNPQFLKDKVLIRHAGSDAAYKEFNSVHDAMMKTGTGTGQDARQFRKVVKEKGYAVWPDDDPRQAEQIALDGHRWEIRLKHPRTSNDELADGVPPKRKGRRGTYGAISRPAQKAFSDDVFKNCFEKCVVTGARTKRRGEAAHLVEHCKDGVDHWSNGLWLRIDIHRLFDANQCAIDPQTLHIHFAPAVLADDQDLAKYQKNPTRTRKQINTDYLQARWERFCEYYGSPEKTFR